jgi:hypothetical protein
MRGGIIKTHEILTTVKIIRVNLDDIWKKSYLEVTLIQGENILYGREKSHIQLSLALFISEATKSSAKKMTLVFRPPGVLVEISSILLHQAREQCCLWIYTFELWLSCLSLEG